MPHAEQSWPGIASDVGEARRFVCRTLNRWDAGRLEWHASALTSELATNAVLHAGTTFSVALSLDGNRLRLEVKDGSAAPPIVRHYDDEATTGRGLRLVMQLSEQWGVDPGQASKTVWCVLPITDEDASPVPDDEVDLDSLMAQFDDDHVPDAAARSAAGGGARGGLAA